MRSKEEIKAIRTAQTVISTAIHPDTKELISWPLRFSSFLPMNIPICFGFIIAAPTPFNTIFWQWINQTYNAALNYANRNASSKYTNQDIIKSYVAACSSSILIGLVIRKALAGRTAGITGAKAYVYNAFSSFFACASAGFLNAWFMRQTEMEKGINVLDPETHESYGVSVVAAKKAVMQTAISRIFLNVTIFFPPLALYWIEKKHMMPKNFLLRTTVEAFFISLELYFAVPTGIALYPRLG